MVKLKPSAFISLPVLSTLLVVSSWAAVIVPREMDSLIGPVGNSVMDSSPPHQISVPNGIESANDLDEAADTIIIPYAVRPHQYRRPWYDAFRRERTYW